MKEQIIKFKQDHPDWGYKRIARAIGCSANTVKYHLRPDIKTRINHSGIENRKKRRQKFKISQGGCCKICGYNKCLNALHFHHLDEETKKSSLASMLLRGSIEKAQEEAKKCILICGNCHAEIHAGITKIE